MKVKQWHNNGGYTSASVMKLKEKVVRAFFLNNRPEVNELHLFLNILDEYLRIAAFFFAKNNT
jgi:hypothetical protein